MPLSQRTLVACHYSNGMESKCICGDNPKAAGLCVIAWEMDEWLWPWKGPRLVLQIRWNCGTQHKKKKKMMFPSCCCALTGESSQLWVMETASAWYDPLGPHRPLWLFLWWGYLLCVMWMLRVGETLPPLCLPLFSANPACSTPCSCVSLRKEYTDGA